MTVVKYTDNEVSAVGHSGYAEAGFDVVCAAISTAFKGVMATFMEYGVKFKSHIDEKQNIIAIQFEPTKSKAVNAIHRGFIEVLKSLRDEYPQFVSVDKVIIEENNPNEKIQ